MKIKTILYIDDDPEDLEILQEAINALNPDVKFIRAEGGREGISALSALCPDVLFLDYNMPQMNGQAVLKAIEKSSCKPKIIMYSTYMMERQIQECISMGADSYRQKPGDFSGVQSVLSEFL